MGWVGTVPTKPKGMVGAAPIDFACEMIYTTVISFTKGKEGAPWLEMLQKYSCPGDRRPCGSLPRSGLPLLR